MKNDDEMIAYMLLKSKTLKEQLLACNRNQLTADELIRSTQGDDDHERWSIVFGAVLTVDGLREYLKLTEDPNRPDPTSLKWANILQRFFERHVDPDLEFLLPLLINWFSPDSLI